MDSEGDKIRKLRSGGMSVHVVVNEQGRVRDFMVRGEEAKKLAKAAEIGAPLWQQGITNVTVYPSGPGGPSKRFAVTPMGVERAG
jgi:hypothetical protein